MLEVSGQSGPPGRVCDSDTAHGSGRVRDAALSGESDVRSVEGVQESSEQSLAAKPSESSGEPVHTSVVGVYLSYEIAIAPVSVVSGRPRWLRR